ncbi:Rad4 transglutaminase-like domain-containing protein [Mariannaea sp. PMI_226]|nr:Rad4 transglutaminase-like domain-containing protein [Mariannaea sp. PMI_226]
MPPLVPRKRLRESSPSPGDSQPSKSKKSKFGAEQRKATLYDDLDATATPQSSRNSNTVLDGFANGDDDESSLTSLSDEEFEDVIPPKADDNLAESSDEEDIVFEDVKAPAAPIPDAPTPTGDLELTLIKDTRMSLTNSFGDKKGPTKRERQVRNATHGLHVLLLLWHNAIRNSWLCDPEVQATMISHLPPKLWDEVDRWRRNSGLAKDPVAATQPTSLGKLKGKGKKSMDRKARDWGADAAKLEEGAIDRSQGDPLFRLTKTLSSWWKQRFRVTCPGLRKWGYMSLERLDRLTKAHATEGYDSKKFGEKIRDLEEFRQHARDCEGSRDVGAQLFTALLRGLGLEARMVASLQSLGFGWTKWEEAEPEKEEDNMSQGPSASSTQKEKAPPKGADKERPEANKATRGGTGSGKRSNRASKKVKDMIISDSDELELEYKDTDDESIVELEVTPRKRTNAANTYDKDLEFPHYWTEVLSPVTNKYLPVEAFVKNVIGTNRALIEGLEPRGAKADSARQIMAYVMGYSQDGTAKDVTVRYLKGNLWPGRTKGMRMAPEKVPIYNRHGKVKRYEQFDWFKTAISGYRKGTRKNPITEIDEMEDATDLKPAEREKKEVKEGQETLQYYKQSKEFVLQRHLKREEALRPSAIPAKVFKNKGRGGKVEEEDVFLRSDVVQVKSAETWHKQGRAPVEGEQPLKRVPYRAATLNRKREIMEAEAATGEKVLQGLYSMEQTDWIIPPPIKDGVIPKNEYGNIDLFAKHMCPQGAAHIPYRGAIRVCKRLQIDYAEAVVDFEFGHRMAVPVIQGVVIAEEHYDKVMEELEKDEVERIRKEDEKRRKKALAQWRRFLMGMRIAERIRQEYGEIDEQVSVFGHSRDLPQHHHQQKEYDEDMAGGFLPEGYEEVEEMERPIHRASGFFATADEDDDGDGGLVMEDHTRTHESKEAGIETGSGPAVEQSAASPKAKKRRPKAQSSKIEPEKPPRQGTRRSTRSRKTIMDDLAEEDEIDV